MGGGKRHKPPRYKPRPPKEEEGNIVRRLPSEILGDIFSRLPVKTIIICKTVCKAWHNLLLVLDPCFTQMHLARSPLNLILYRFPTLSLIEFYDNEDLGKKKISKFDCVDPALFSSGNKKYQQPQLVGSSCNGWLYFSIIRPTEVHYVWIPVMNEKFLLPNPKPQLDELRMRCQSGLGFCPRTNLYKVVRMFPCTHSILEAMQEPRNQEGDICEVLTLGTEAWRTIKDVPMAHGGRMLFKMPNHNGAIHWFCSCRTNGDEKFPIWICAFRIEDEKWDPILLPLALLESRPGLELYERVVLLLSWLQLGMLDNCLAIYDKTQSSLLDIWMMKSYGVRESWSKRWSIQTHIGPDQIDNVYTLLPLRVTKNGEVVMFESRDISLVRFNPQNGTLCKQKVSSLIKPRVTEPYLPTAYFASFISLKEVMKKES